MNIFKSPVKLARKHKKEVENPDEQLYVEAEEENSVAENLPEPSNAPKKSKGNKEQLPDPEIMPETGQLTTDNLVKRYGKRTVVNHVSIDVRQGEIVGLLGPNGAGKTTLIRIINHITAPDSGRVLLDGAPLELTETEFSILHCLAENRGRVVPVRTIYETVWHETYMPASNNTVMVHIVNLRKKLEEDPANPRLIRTVWGKGYQID